MRINRDISIKINFILDELLPPIIRDSWVIFFVPFKLLFRSDSFLFKNFKEDAPRMTEERYGEIYKRFDNFSLERSTDLNTASVEEIQKNISGKKVLEVGSGKGYLSRLLSDSGYHVTGVDLNLKKVVQENLVFESADIGKLPYGDKTFDTVICAHVLEHVLDAEQALAELRRVTKHRLIIVLPRQRAYKYTFDLHIRFFPYRWSVLMFTGTKNVYRCENVGGDWYYQEESEIAVNI